MRSETWHLIVDFLTGSRNIGNGKKRGERGRPKASEEQRRARNPTHDAVDEYPRIRDAVRRLYARKVSAESINHFARGLAADRANMRVAALGDGKSLTGARKINNLRKRSKRTGHKIE